MTPLRLGIIGCGGMEKAHERGLVGLADQVRITAVCDIVAERANTAKELLKADLAVTDYHDLLGAVDAVLIVLPHHLHHPVGRDCLLAGKHVLMEKPLAITDAECLDLIHLSESRRLTLMAGYVQRYNPLVLKAKELMDSGAAGTPFQVSIWTEQFTKFPDDKSWGHKIATLGGGQFLSHGCHYVDLLLWFLGRPLRGFHLGTNFGTPWMEKEGTSNVVFQFESGATAYHFGTWGAKGSRLRYSIHIHGTEAMIDARLHEGKIFINRFKEGEQLVFEAETGKHTATQMAHFLDCVRTGRRPLTDGPGSLQSLRVIWRLYEAEEKNVAADLRGLGLDQPWDIPGLDKLPK